MDVTKVARVQNALQEALPQPASRPQLQGETPTSVLANGDSAAATLRRSASTLQEASRIVLFPKNDAENMVSGGISVAVGAAAIGFAVSRRSPAALTIGLAAGGALAIAGSARLKEAFEATFGTIAANLN